MTACSLPSSADDGVCVGPLTWTFDRPSGSFDLFACAQVLSASNGGEGSCELTVNSGTSMSCPIVAGACALIRQYFQDGFYADDLAARGEQLCPSGDDDDAASFSFPCSSFGASGALVKVTW